MLATLIGALVLSQAPAEPRPSVLVVVGAAGAADYGEEFRAWAERWRDAAGTSGADVATVGLDAEDGRQDLERIESFLAGQAAETDAVLWIVLIGHGTFDGREAKFNLRGPDLTAARLAEWIEPVRRPVALINCASASGPFLNALSGPGRVIVTATRSGDEQNLARFGEYMAAAIGDTTADLDKDGQASLLEVFLAASGRVEESYKAEARLATEHALIDDNGDRLGTPADWFRGVRATRRAEGGAAADGARAHQLHLIPGRRELELSEASRRRRDELELAIEALRAEKDALGEQAYFERLEPLMVELARIYGD